jgi:translation initiation factor IF-3
MFSTKPHLVIDNSKYKIINLVDAENRYNRDVDVLDAIRQAKEASLDLVCFAEREDPPMCKLIDYGRWKYDNDKRHKKKKTQKSGIKEIRFNPTITEHDISHKVRHIREFIDHGHQVNVMMRIKGRQNRDVAKNKIDYVIEKCKEFASITMNKVEKNYILVRISKKTKKGEVK